MENSISLSPEQITSDLLPQKFGRRGMIWTTILVVIALFGLYAYYRQLRYGLIVTHMRDYVSWGIYISNFVFFVAISLVGSLITAIFRLTNVKWRTPLTRIAEIIAVSAIVFAALIIVVDMGRPDRFMNLFLHGRIQSPILWDVIVISTYFFISILLLYFPLLPDLKILLKFKEKTGKRLNKLYRFQGSFWKGTKAQFQLKREINQHTLCVNHSRRFQHTHRYFMVVCYHVSPGMGQHQLRCIFYFRCFSCRSGRGSRSYVCFPALLSPGKIYNRNAF